MSCDQESDVKSNETLDSTLSITTCASYDIVEFQIATCDAVDIFPASPACSSVLEIAVCDSLSIVDNFDDLNVMQELVATLLSCLYEDDNVALLPQPVNHTMKWLKNEVRVLTKFVFDEWMRDFTYDAATGSFSWRGVGYDEVTKTWKPIFNVSSG